jgi:hypothetical protein
MRKRYWLAGTAALALMASGAVAQTTIETTRQTTVAPVTVLPPAPVVNGYSQTKTERSTDGYGNQSETTQTWSSNSAGTSSRTETQVKRLDGSTESAYREQWSSSTSTLPPSQSSVTTTIVPAPVYAPPVGTTTTTTTIRR